MLLGQWKFVGLETFTPYLSSEAYQWDLSSHTQAVMTLLNTEINPMKSLHFVVVILGMFHFG